MCVLLAERVCAFSMIVLISLLAEKGEDCSFCSDSTRDTTFFFFFFFFSLSRVKCESSDRYLLFFFNETTKRTQSPKTITTTCFVMPVEEIEIKTEIWRDFWKPDDTKFRISFPKHTQWLARYSGYSTIHITLGETSKTLVSMDLQMYNYVGLACECTVWSSQCTIWESSQYWFTSFLRICRKAVLGVRPQKNAYLLGHENNTVQPETGKWVSSPSHFPSFNCCLSVVL